MAKGESGMRQRIVKLLRAHNLDPVSIESSCSPGTPDINYLHGWIELKCLEHWPVMGGALKVPHFTPQQRIWLKRRCAAGGRAYVLIRVAKDWALLNGAFAAQHLGGLTRQDFEGSPRGFWPGRLDEAELIDHLS